MAKILLVEDDNNLREIYEARLQAEGYDIVSARDGEEALTVAMKEKPDLIISDVMMPKISGFDMLDILRTTEETKNVKIIMMTALSQAEDKERAEKLGADRYLVKSQVTLEDVAKVAREVLEGTSPEPTTQTQVPETAPAPEVSDGEGDPVVVTTPAAAPVPQPEQPAVSSIPPQPAPVSVSVQEPPAVVQDPAPTTTSNLADDTTATPVATSAVDSVAQPTPTVVQTVDPTVQSQASTTPVAPTTGLDVIAQAQPAPEPMTSVPTTTSIPVGTPDDTSFTQPSMPPTSDTTDPVAPTSDPMTDSVESEEQAIARQIQENLKQTQAIPTPPPTATEPQSESMPTPVQPPTEEPQAPMPSEKKVISPINDLSAPGPDLESMATKEEILSQVPVDLVETPAQNGPVVIEPTTPPQETQPATNPSDNNTSSNVNPNSIAL